jgi:hypothetical protein
MRSGPCRGFGGVAMRIGGGKAQIGAAVEPLAAMNDSPEFLFGGSGIDARDQKPFADTVLEQFHADAHPAVAAGQDHDRVGVIDLAGLKLQGLDEDDEADGVKRHCGQNGQSGDRE